MAQTLRSPQQSSRKKLQAKLGAEGTSTRLYDVLVVGAGAAGAIAAREIARAGHRVAVLEASDRVGGRMRTVTDAVQPGPVELGAEFIHGKPEVTLALLREFGGHVVESSHGGFVIRDGRLVETNDDRFDRVTELLALALERDADETVEALIARHVPGTMPVDTAYWARRLVAGFDAADPARASAKAIAREWCGDASADGTQTRPDGGYAPLVAHLARTLAASGAQIDFRTVVARIARDAEGITITARHEDRDVVYGARRAILTIPHGVLAAPADDRGALAFEPQLPERTCAAIAGIAMGPVLKVVLCFRYAFWETLSGGALRTAGFFTGDGAFPTYWVLPAAGANTLVAWCGGPPADRLAGSSDEQLQRIALATAGEYFGNAEAVNDAFAAAYVHDWQRDPLFRGAYSYVLAGNEYAREALAEPIDNVLWIAGEATAREVEGGTVAGALESGMRAARQVIASLA